MSDILRRVRAAAGRIVPEGRPHFKRIDVSPAVQDDGAWLDSPPR